MQNNSLQKYQFATSKHNLLDEASREFINLINELKRLEGSIGDKMQRFGRREAELKIESGILLNKLKEVVNQGKRKGCFETMATKFLTDEHGKIFLKKTARTERMKVARLDDALDYSYLGWTKLVSIAEVIDRQEKSIVNFMNKIGFNLNHYHEVTSSEFSIYFKTFYFMQILKDNKINNVSQENVEIAVRRGQSFDKKFLTMLAKSPDPDLHLRMHNEFGITTAPTFDRIKTSQYGSIGELMEKLIGLLMAVRNEANGSQYLEKIAGYTYEDLAHELGVAFTLAGYRG